MRRNPHRELEGLLVVESWVDLRAVGARKIALLESTRAADALGHVLACELEVHAAQAAAVLAMDPSQAKLAFQVISERYDHRRATAITTNRPFKDWTKVFPDALNAQVIAERLTERSERFVLDGKGYRQHAAT